MDDHNHDHDGSDDRDEQLYEFVVGYDPEPGDDQDEENGFDHGRWSRGRHAGADEREDEQAEQVALEEMLAGMDLSEQRQELVDDLLEKSESIQSFEFVCHLCNHGHGHGDNKHDITYDLGYAGFRVREDFADQLEWEQGCHCGLAELSMLMDYFELIDQQVFEDQDDSEFDLDSRIEKIRAEEGNAPNPDHVYADLREKREQLDSLREESDDEEYPLPLGWELVESKGPNGYEYLRFKGPRLPDHGDVDEVLVSIIRENAYRITTYRENEQVEKFYEHRESIEEVVEHFFEHRFDGFTL